MIFFCGSCHRAWQITGVDLTDVPHEIADIRPDAASPGPAAGTSTCRSGSSSPRAGPTRRTAGRPPSATGASRCCTTCRAADREAPLYRPWTGERPAGTGCFYDAEDAALLARIRGGGPAADAREVKAAALAEPAFGGARLTWIPSPASPIPARSLDRARAPEALLG